MKLFKSIIFILAVLIAVLGIVLFNSRPKSQKALETAPVASENISPGNIAADKALWSKKIDELGASAAYKDYVNTYADKNFGIQHTAAHLMGRLLYEKEGLTGLTICDSTFAFGCYHGFYSPALADQGLSIIPTADKLCVDKFGPLGTGCQHGIGHGLMDYFGPKKLTQALDACSMTTQQKNLFGCTSGVFMEYNVPILITEADAQTVPRALDKNQPYAPCPSVATKYQGSCYYEMAQWWDKATTFNGDYKKIGELCQALSLTANRESCFLGVGNVAAPSSDYVVAGTIDKCEEMPTSESKVICRSGASWSFFSSVTYRSLAAQVCANLDENTQKKCVQKSDLIGNGLK